MRRVAVLLTGMLAAFVARADDRLPCANGIVPIGADVIGLRNACGEPTLREVLGEPGFVGGAYDEEWFYNFGPRERLRIVRLREGRVQRIEDDGYGFQGLPNLTCDFASLREGLSKFRLWLACRLPHRRETLVVYRQLERGASTVEPLLRERWHYNSAVGELLRIVTMENGRIVNVEEKQARGPTSNIGGRP